MGTIVNRGTNKKPAYRAQIQLAGHPSISKTFKKKDLASDWIRTTETKMIAGDYREDTTLFQELVHQYLTVVGKAQDFGRSKINVLDRLARDLGSVQVCDLTSARLTKYAIDRGQAPSTVMQDMIYIGVVLRIGESMFGAKPKINEYELAITGLKSTGIIAEAEECDRRVLDSEVDEIMQHMKSGLPMRDLIDFSIVTAMRNGEVFRLKWADLGDNGRSVLIRSRKHPKKKRDERVPLLAPAVAIIEKSKKLNGNSEYIFPYNGKSVSAAFQRARNAAGLDDIRWHDLRHEGCSRLVEAGHDLITVSLFSGHRDLNSLKRYTHLQAKTVLDRIEGGIN
jgi:integrase